MAAARRFCWDHPHNYYLEALVNGGFPGLILFCALGLAWLAALGRGLWRQPDPLRVALFAAALIQLWPIASVHQLHLHAGRRLVVPAAGLGPRRGTLAEPAARPYIGANILTFRSVTHG